MTLSTRRIIVITKVRRRRLARSGREEDEEQ